MVGGGWWWGVGGTFDFRVTPNPNFMLDVNLDEEFDNMNMSNEHVYCILSSNFKTFGVSGVPFG